MNQYFILNFFLWTVILKGEALEYLAEEGCSCGKSSDVEASIIINGDVVQGITKYPWMVRIGLEKRYSYHCGGALISDSFVMTAAHCVKRKELKKMKRLPADRADWFYKPRELRLLHESEKRAGKHRLRVKRVVPHPKYHPRTKLYDIALLELEKKLECRNELRPVCLSTDKRLAKRNHVVTAVGWGRYKPDKPSKKLREAPLILLNEKRCKEKTKYKNLENRLCLAGDYGKGTCFGDSGSPVVLKKKDRFYAIGVVSTTRSRECDTTMPSFVTDVAHYVPWVERYAEINAMKD